MADSPIYSFSLKIFGLFTVLTVRLARALAIEATAISV